MMSLDKVLVVKVGGSVLSVKGDTERVLNDQGLAAVREVARQCAARGVRLVLVTGAGSFGHVLAKRYSFKTVPVAPSLSVDRARQGI
jgi:isopentenyl phosphate kinase